MGARNKLNQAYATGSLIFGTVAGVVTQSWTIFMVVSAVGLAMNFFGGDIRPGSKRLR